jgi:beta-glucosidase
VITAKGPGVATVTASVTVGLRTESGSFPVKVMPELNPASISVNNRTVKGFHPEVKQYSFLMKKPSSVAPVVGATQKDPGVIMETVQAKGIPGTASILVRDPLTVDQNEYTVNFGIRSVSDEFSGPGLGGHWTWIREDPANWSLSAQPGSLVITSDTGDITESNNDGQNLLLQSANTDWTIESRLVCSRKPSGFSQNGGILAYEDDDNFVKLVYRASFGRRGFRRGGEEQPGSAELFIESGGDQKYTSTLSMDGIVTEDNTLILKLVKQGDRYTASVSSDGNVFETVGTGTVVLKDIQAGMMVCDGVLPARFAGFRRFMQQTGEPDTPFEVAFDYFRISNTGLK